MVFLSGFFVLVITGYPIWDYFYMKKVHAGKVKKKRMYTEIMAVQWAALLVISVYWLVTGHDFRALFVFDQPVLSLGASFWVAYVTGIVAVILFVVIYAAFLKKKDIVKRNHRKDPIGEIDFLLPNTHSERLLFLFVAITAGICEEIIFRGVFYYYLSNLPLDLSIWVIGLISSALFGFVHLYQGFKGVLATAYIGALMFVIFAATGYLWPAILFHILIDARAAFLMKKE